MEKQEFRAKLQTIDAVDRLAFVVAQRAERVRQSTKCNGCWLQRQNCICETLNCVWCKTRVIVHIHHGEWGICSNTGICIHRTLKNSHFLLRGLQSHDEKLQEILEENASTICVLWPGDGAISVEELKQRLSPEERPVLIVPDGTFSNARRMTKKYPQKCIKVALSSASVLEGKTNSFLYPVRKYGGSESKTGRVSTLEAVAAFMREMGEDPTVAKTLISNMKLQMDCALKQKCRAMIYGTTRPL